MALLSTLALCMHMSYNAFAYAVTYYNPILKAFATTPLILCVIGHGICGMCSVFLLGDGTRLDIYQGPNRRTIVQRVSAALIFPVLIMHLRTFELLSTLATEGAWVPFALVVLLQVAFFAVVSAHAATSFSKALITLGLLANLETQKRLDKVVYTLFTIAFVVATFAVIRGELLLFLPN